jgi:hypothetical protein
MPKSQPTLWTRATNTTWKKAVIAVGVLALIVLIPYGIAEYNYQLRVQKLVHTLQSVGQKVLKPHGGVNVMEPGVGGHCTHVINAMTAIDTGPCPIAASSWLVPVTKGQETELLTSILRDSGFSEPTSSWGGGGKYNDVGISIAVHPGTASNKEPYSLSPDKEWAIVNVDAQE